MLLRQKTQNGFSLIELMIAVVVVAIITAIAVPSYNSFIKRSRRSEATTALSQIASRQEIWYTTNDRNTYSNDPADVGFVGGTTTNGYYNIVIAGSGSRGLVSGFVLTATAVAGTTQADDRGCQVLTLDSNGNRTPAECWNR